MRVYVEIVRRSANVPCPFEHTGESHPNGDGDRIIAARFGDLRKDPQSSPHMLICLPFANTKAEPALGDCSSRPSQIAVQQHRGNTTREKGKQGFNV